MMARADLYALRGDDDKDFKTVGGAPGLGWEGDSIVVRKDVMRRGSALTASRQPG